MTRLLVGKKTVFNIQFGTSDNRTLNTQDLYFQPTLTQANGNQVLSMKLKVSETKFLEYRYELKPSDYMLDFSVKSQGLDGVINGSQDIVLDWKLKGHRQAKSIAYENRYTRLTYKFEEDNIDFSWVNEEECDSCTFSKCSSLIEEIVDTNLNITFKSKSNLFLILK